jgi:hypothetical protein
MILSQIKTIVSSPASQKQHYMPRTYYTLVGYIMLQGKQPPKHLGPKMLQGELQNVNSNLNLSTTITISAPGGAYLQINTNSFRITWFFQVIQCPRMANCCSSWEQATIPPFSRGSIAVKHSKSVCPSHKLDLHKSHLSSSRCLIWRCQNSAGETLQIGLSISQVGPPQVSSLLLTMSYLKMSEFSWETFKISSFSQLSASHFSKTSESLGEEASKSKQQIQWRLHS